ncbi:hypothetical protein [Chitiniphilus shinanonensis]|uniref:hypothetical protein n=1 Tax=Chitiniphilus shinanonensis TaxID=553088 RepID=UPI00302E72EC
MLQALETLLQTDLQQALGERAALTVGAVAPAPQAGKAAVWLNAASLDTDPGDDPGRVGRGSAHLLRSQTLTPIAKQPGNFALPAGQTVVDVQAPPGRLLNAADHYTQDGATLRFLTPPPSPVLARLRGERARGYVERMPARGELLLSAWAENGPAAAALLGDALGSVLARLSEIDVVELVTPGAGPLAMRLYRPAAWLARLENSSVRLGNRDWLVAAAHIGLRGEIELALAIGTPEPTSLIERIEATAQVVPARQPD